MSYPWIKTLHILFVIAWMAAVFYLPRILVNVAEVGDAAAIRERLLLMGRRLYKFGHIMFAFMVLFGLTLWMHFKIAGPWLHAKLVLVAILFAFYIHSGRYLKKAAAGAASPVVRSRAGRWRLRKLRGRRNPTPARRPTCPLPQPRPSRPGRLRPPCAGRLMIFMPHSISAPTIAAC